MKEKAEFFYQDFVKAINNLLEALQHASSPLEIDGTIKRFELSFETGWKLIKEHLEVYGLICNNPRDCFKGAVKNGLITNELGWMDMIRDRNALVHAYTFEQSRIIYDKIKAKHATLLKELHEVFRSQYPYLDK